MHQQPEMPRRSKGMASDRLVAQRGRLPLGEALRIVRHVCNELEHIHAIPLTHRGVEPGNIVVTPEGGAKLQGLNSNPVALDDVRAQADREEALPSYVAPEEALGQPADPRADIYGLGAAFYFFLTGRPLFERVESTEARMQHVTDTAPAVTEIVPSVPPVYARIIAKMLAKPLEDRYQTIAALRTDLDAAEAGRPTSADQFHAVSSCALPAGPSPTPQAADVGTSISPLELTATRALAGEKIDLSGFEWNDRFCLGVPELDAQHKWWFRITRNFVRMIRQGKPNEEAICDLLQQLMRYASNHFAAEERFMTTICYSPFEFEQHRTAHRAFEARLDAITDDLLSGKPGVDRELATFLAHWLSQHILEVDVKYIRFYRDRQNERRQSGARRLWAI
jgi:hemerythrin-like metal-binding protein